jgi:sugar phosphate permease
VPVSEFNQSIVTEVPVPRQRITRWHIATVALLMFGYSGYYFCRSDYSVALPLILAEQVRHGASQHAAELRLGSIASYGVLAYAIGKIPAGAMADRLGGRKNFLGGMLGSILFTVMFLVSGSFPLFTIAWIGNRFVQTLGWAGLVRVSSRWFSFSHYGSVMAVLSLSYLFGDAVSREIMSLLLLHGMGWRGLFLTGAGILTLLLVLNLAFLRENPQDYHLPPAEDNPAIRFQQEEGKTNSVRLGEVFRGLFTSYAFWLVCFISLGTTLLRETFNLWMPTYFSLHLGFNNSQAASGSAIFPLCGGISVLLAGWAGDALGKVGRSRLIFAGVGLSAPVLVGFACLPARSEGWLPLLLLGLIALLLIGPYSYLSGAMSLDFGGKAGGATASGIVDTFGYIAGVLSGNGVAHITASYGWKTLFLSLACVAALSSVVAGLLMKHQLDT